MTPVKPEGTRWQTCRCSRAESRRCSCGSPACSSELHPGATSQTGRCPAVKPDDLPIEVAEVASIPADLPVTDVPVGGKPDAARGWQAR